MYKLCGLDDMTPLPEDTDLIHRVYAEARSNRNAFFDKLALLDGGTVALVITAVLGPLHGVLKHKYFLGVGLSVLALAMLILLRRNLVAAQYEVYVAGITVNNPEIANSPKKLAYMEWTNKDIHYSGGAGVLLSGLGIVLLLVEVWFLLLS